MYQIKDSIVDDVKLCDIVNKWVLKEITDRDDNFIITILCFKVV